MLIFQAVTCKKQNKNNHRLEPIRACEHWTANFKQKSPKHKCFIIIDKSIQFGNWIYLQISKDRQRIQLYLD